MTTKKTKQTVVEFDFQRHIFALLLEEPFYAVISRYVEKRENKNIPTARVFVNQGGNFIMEYNPAFFEPLTTAQRLGILKHELQHILLGHLTTRCPDIKSDDFKFWNHATDLAINSLLPREQLPDGVLIPGEAPFQDLKPQLCSEAYLNLLKKKCEEKDPGKNSSDHSGWMEQGDGQGGKPGEDGDDGTGERYQIAEHRIKDIIQKAVNETTAMSHADDKL